MTEPQNEASLIIGILENRADLQISSHLTALDPEAFVSPSHRRIWAGMQVITLSGGLIDSWTLSKTLKKLGGSEADSQLVTRYFEEIQYSFGSLNLPARIAQVAEDYKRRTVARMADALSCGMDGLSWPDVEFALGEVSAKVSQAGNPRFQAGTDYSKQVEAFLRGNPVLPQESRDNLVVFGIPGIDDCIMANPGRLIVIGALPSAGKTALAIQAAIRTAQSGRRVALASLEMDADEIAARIIACACGVNSLQVLRYGGIPDPEDRAILESIRKNLVGLHGCAGDSWPSIEAAIIREHRRAPLSVAIVDYLQLMGSPETGPSRRNDNEAQRIGEITKSAKRLAQRLGINVVLVSQFNREAEEAKEPTLQNFLGSGQIERDIDIALMLWNEQIRYEPKQDRVLLCRIAKNRGGERYSLVRTIFRPALNRFREDHHQTQPVSKYASVTGEDND